MRFFWKWGILGSVARFAGYIIFSLIVLFAPLVWAVRALAGKILQLARRRCIPVIPAPERSPDDARTRQILDDPPARELGGVCQTGHCCGVGCGCLPTESQHRRNKGGVLMADKVTAGFSREERERMIAVGGTSAYYEADYPDMNEDEELVGPMGSFEQVISWLIGGFIAVTLITLALLAGAGWAIWRFWPAGWRLW